MPKLAAKNSNPPRLDGQRILMVEENAYAANLAPQTPLSAGMDACVVKPFSIGSLVKRVDRASRRSADFIVNPAYVSPDRRARSGTGAGQRRFIDMPVAANESSPDPDVRVAPSADLEGDEVANTLLMELYAHIRALEAERAAQTR